MLHLEDHTFKLFVIKVHRCNGKHYKPYGTVRNRTEPYGTLYSDMLSYGAELALYGVPTQVYLLGEYVKGVRGL